MRRTCSDLGVHFFPERINPHERIFPRALAPSQTAETHTSAEKLFYIDVFNPQREVAKAGGLEKQDEDSRREREFASKSTEFPGGASKESGASSAAAAAGDPRTEPARAATVSAKLPVPAYRPTVSAKLPPPAYPPPSPGGIAVRC